MLTHKGTTVTDPLHIANIFNHYFSSIAEKNNANIKFSNKSFQDFLHHPNAESLFITPTDTHEVNLRKIVRKVSKLAFYLTGLQHNDDPILSLRSPNYTLHLFFIFSLLCSNYLADLIKKTGIALNGSLSFT